MVNAVFTLLFNSAYLPGALVLGRVLRELAAREEEPPALGVLVDKSKLTEFQLALLRKTYDKVLFIEPLTSHLTEVLQTELRRPELAATFSKVLLWSLSDYDKVLYLDADTLPLVNNPDASVLDLLKIDFPKNKIMAVPDSGFPDVFNSGVFVIQPNHDDFSELAALATSAQADISFDGADQGLLNQYFNSNPDWVGEILQTEHRDASYSSTAASSNWIKLPFFYNVTPSTQYQYGPAYEHFSSQQNGAPSGYGAPDSWSDAGSSLAHTSSSSATDSYYFTAFKYAQNGSRLRLLHFIGPHKPWSARATAGIHKQWWDAFDKHFSSQPSSVPLQKKTAGNSTVDPQKLLDPSTYESSRAIGPSVHMSWDSGSHSPPKTRPTVIDPLFAKSLSSFSNSWSQQGTHQDTLVSESSHTDRGGLAPSSLARPDPNSDFASTVPSFPSTAPNQHDLAQINARLSSLSASSNHMSAHQASDHSSQASSDIQTPNPPKIFPWEHREDALPAERHFDY